VTRYINGCDVGRHGEEDGSSDEAWRRRGKKTKRTRRKSWGAAKVVSRRMSHWYPELCIPLAAPGLVGAAGL